MILYDESYNFLGMSEKVLTRLGYDDLDEFCTYHKDFAELFEKENGLIYNFENFSWLDFILYGGSDKDSAIVKTKSGEKFKAKIKVDEIKVKDDILGISKLFSVKLIEKEIIENSTPTQTSNNINLSSMLEKKEEENQIGIEVKKDLIKTDEKISNNFTKNEDSDLDINLSFIKNEDLKEDTTTTKPSFSLDFLKDDTQTKTTDATFTLQSDKPSSLEIEDKEDDVVLNFFNSTVEEKESPTTPSLNLDFIKEEKQEEKQEDKQDEKEIETSKEDSFQNLKIDLTPKEEQTPTINLNISQVDEKKDKEEIKPINISIESNSEKQDKKEDEPLINLNFLKTDADTKDSASETIKQDEVNEDKKEPLINLNFLKSDDKKEEPDIIQNVPEVEEKKDETPSINLNFLKIDEDDEKQTEQKILNDNKEEEKKDEEPLINLNFLKLDDDNDKKETKIEDKTSIEQSFLDIKKPKEEKKEIRLDLQTPSINTESTEPAELNPEKKSKIIQQIKEDINEIDQNEPIIKPQNNENDEIVINDALKSILNINTTTNETNTQGFQQEETKDISQPKVEENKPEVNKIEKFEFLPNLNISDDEKRNILKDFLDDATYNLNLIKKYINEMDMQSVKFLATKIKSSAEILELNTISSAANSIFTEGKTLEIINKHIQTISKELEKLKNYL